ncbi:YqjF family protein [Sandaracinus amylolyticus]|uniref:DUF2071 domain-containing protein n=1 Tax=Sandaracinus amylolyticus TaxID=927083 RepID=A0A0F6W152_9BACT|nr:DUF2071 domain-containing protein [Sandaracinus amylolyticus]AKF04786.1 Hypothetical protein DB32_001935 [Sandaracinus amylolyticus]
MTLDRIAPTRRPEGANAGTQRWRELLFVHWSVSLDEVRALVPAALELDAWEGRAWIGAVPFRMEQIRPSWLPGALALDFLELNLRTYVHHRGRPGVWFFSLEASSWLAVRAARVGWSLPYWHARMRTERDGARVLYASSRRGHDARFDVDYEIGDALGASAPGTFEHFLLERYLLFAAHRGRILEGQVHHAPYPAHRARVLRLEQTLTAAAGLPALQRAPEILHWSPGVDVEVFGPRAT